MFNPLHSISNQELFVKHLYNPRHTKRKNSAARPNYINYRLKSEVSITLRCRLCSTRYTAVRIKNCLKSTSAIKIATMKNMDDFRYEGKPSRATAKSPPFAVTVSATQRRTPASPRRMHLRTAVCRKAPVGPKRRPANSEKIKPIALAVSRSSVKFV